MQRRNGLCGGESLLTAEVGSAAFAMATPSLSQTGASERTGLARRGRVPESSPRRESLVSLNDDKVGEALSEHLVDSFRCEAVSGSW